MAFPDKAKLVRWVVAGVILTAAVALLPRLDRQARQATVMSLLESALGDLEAQLPPAAEAGGRPVRLTLEGDAPDWSEVVTSRLAASPAFEPSGSGPALVVRVDLARTPAAVGLGYAPGSPQAARAAAEGRMVNAWSVLPPLVAIVAALATGRLVLSLLVAVFLGGLLAAGPNPLAFTGHAVRTYFWEAVFTDPFKLWILVFTTALLGLVQLVTRAGGIHAIVDRIAARARGTRSTQLATAFLGFAVFFDDYANTLLVGSTMRPLTDRMRISREKLSYLVDSTSAPVAGLAVISTWIGYEVGLLDGLAGSLGLGRDGYELFFMALPFRFYCVFALALVLLVAGSGRDWGAMARAERRAAATGLTVRPGAVALASRTFESVAPVEGVARRPSTALWPIGVVLLGTLVGLFWDGGGFAQVARDPASLLSFEVWRTAFGSAENSTRVLALASLAGSALAFGLVWARGLLSVREAVVAYLRGMRSMYLALVILILAWAIKAVADDLGTSWFLVASLRDLVVPALLPLLVFVSAAVVAFATGSSWGTMGILIPTAMPLAWHVGGEPLMLVSTAAVLDGAIFGDHVSPISDTTVMSSIASGSDHLDHVRTQAPYAGVAMIAAAGFGYLWTGLGLPGWLGWPLGLGLLAAVVFGVGRNVRAALPPRPEEEAEADGAVGPDVA